MPTTINKINIGGIDKDIEDAFAREQIEQIVSPSGEAPNPSEITDARIGDSSKVYANLGTAIRSQVSDLADAIGDRAYVRWLQTKAACGCQLLKNATAVNGSVWIVNSANKLVSWSAENAKRFMPVLLYAGVTYTFVNVYRYFTIFTDLDKETVLGRLSSEDSTIPYTASYTPSQDCYAYVSRQTVTTNEERQPTMILLGDKYPDTYTEGIFGRSFEITADDCREFLKPSYQYLKESTAVDGSVWYWASGDVVGTFSSNGKRYQRVFLKGGRVYKFWNVYGYFTIFADFNGNVLGRLTEVQTSNVYTATYTPSQDCYAYVSIHKGEIGNKKAMLTDSIGGPSTYVEGLYSCSFINDTGTNSNTGIDITVKKDGSGDYSSIVSAVNYANALPGEYPVNIHVYTGTYDILEELGGSTFIASLDNSTSELQGFGIRRDNVNLIGEGYPRLIFRMPDTVTKNQSLRTSCLNLTYYSARVENFVLIAKNCRYVIHDEGNNYSKPIHRVLKNLTCIHEGNKSGLWAYPTVLGGGNTGGATYDIINCQFKTNNYMQAFSYHCNSGQEPSRYNVDGCVGITNSSSGISFRWSYMGPSTAPVGNTIVNLKNCSGNARIVVEPEQSGNPDSTPNFIELYENGFKTIS